MKAPNYFFEKDAIQEKFSKEYLLRKNYGIIHDAPNESTQNEYDPNEDYQNQKLPDPELIKRFHSASILFRTRVELLANIEHYTTENESESMKVMLQALLEGKSLIQKNKKTTR